MKKSTGNPKPKKGFVNRTGNFKPLDRYSKEELEVIWRRVIDEVLGEMGMGPIYFSKEKKR